MAYLHEYQKNLVEELQEYGKVALHVFEIADTLRDYGAEEASKVARKIAAIVLEDLENARLERIRNRRQEGADLVANLAIDLGDAHRETADLVRLPCDTEDLCVICNRVGKEQFEGLFYYDESYPGTHVYFVQTVESARIKIGIASDVSARVVGLRTSSSEDLFVVGLFPQGGIGLERQLHAVFEESRRHGEWFDLTEALVSFIHRFVPDRPNDLLIPRDWIE